MIYWYQIDRGTLEAKPKATDLSKAKMKAIVVLRNIPKCLLQGSTVGIVYEYCNITVDVVGESLTMALIDAAMREIPGPYSGVGWEIHNVIRLDG